MATNIAYVAHFVCVKIMKFLWYIFSYHLCVPKFWQLYFHHIKTIGKYLLKVKGDSHHFYLLLGGS